VFTIQADDLLAWIGLSPYRGTAAQGIEFLEARAEKIQHHFGLVEHGVPVIFDATANRRSYRERFLEVYVDCPLEVCIARDPKGIYRNARQGAAGNVPGLQTAYEPPEDPDVGDGWLRCAARCLASSRHRGPISRRSGETRIGRTPPRTQPDYHSGIGEFPGARRTIARHIPLGDAGS
jgi:hypothetical protein